jgi:hypothetical protein
VEENFQAGKGLTGLDQHQVRRWTSWHRATILSMLAHAFLAVTTATERSRRAAPTGWIRLTCNEIRHLSPPYSSPRSATSATGYAAQPGDDNTNAAPNDATTNDASDATIQTAKTPAQPNITNSGCSTRPSCDTAGSILATQNPPVRSR